MYEDMVSFEMMEETGVPEKITDLCDHKRTNTVGQLYDQLLFDVILHSFLSSCSCILQLKIHSGHVTRITDPIATYKPGVLYCQIRLFD